MQEQFGTLMISTWLVVSAISSVLVLYGLRRRQSVWWGLFAAAAFLAAVGLTGLLVGFLFYRDTLLGGFGVVFGPLWWLGAPSVLLLGVAWYVSKRRQMRRQIR